MKPNIQDLDALISAAKTLKAAQISYEKKCARARDVDMSMSIKAIRKAETDMHWDAMHVERSWDTLHAACVDLGLCEAHSLDFYREKEMKWSGFHGHVYQPTKPRAIAKVLGSET